MSNKIEPKSRSIFSLPNEPEPEIYQGELDLVDEDSPEYLAEVAEAEAYIESVIKRLDENKILLNQAKGFCIHSAMMEKTRGKRPVSIEEIEIDREEKIEAVIASGTIYDKTWFQIMQGEDGSKAPGADMGLPLLILSTVKERGQKIMLGDIEIDDIKINDDGLELLAEAAVFYAMVSDPRFGLPPFDTHDAVNAEIKKLAELIQLQIGAEYNGWIKK